MRSKIRVLQHFFDGPQFTTEVTKLFHRGHGDSYENHNFLVLFGSSLCASWLTH